MIAIGDKVVCVDDTEYTPVERRRLLRHPGGKVSLGTVYTVAFLFVTPRGNLKVGIVGLPVIRILTGEDIGWRSKRFRKLGDYRAERELAYYRSLPRELTTTEEEEEEERHR